MTAYKNSYGFTLIEMTMVIVLLGILSVGIGSFLKLGTSMYVQAVDREEIISTGRFVVERLNREVRTALPNSLRVSQNGSGTKQCVEFMPSVASAIYIDVPVAPEAAASAIELIKFDDSQISQASNVVVYPLLPSELYGSGSNKMYPFANVTKPAGNIWSLALTSPQRFAQDSPTKRLFFVDLPVAYCATTGQLTRHYNYGYNTDNTPNNTGVLMAEYINLFNDSGVIDPPFVVQGATHLRNATVQVRLKFTINDDNMTFNNDIQVQNVP